MTLHVIRVYIRAS